jgi:2-succinyl-5-enolpyruvyl-6-hydroxy-3-cyclohexene-1-carboxylate synthase
VNVVGEWGRVIARTLADAGVTDVVVSPGSRSTPFVVSIDTEPRLDVRVVIDERSAAFFALGRARVTGRPTAILCTSGTAAANYLPAVVEADAASIPLVVLTADRPLSLMECGANQTIEQLGLYRDRTRFALDLGAPSAELRDMRAARRGVLRAVAEASGPHPGPVHLNLRAEKPLEPGPARSDADRRAESAASDVLALAATKSDLGRLSPSDETLDALTERIARAERPVLVAGPAAAGARAHGESLAALCREASIPLLAEATSQHRFSGRVRRGVPVFDFFGLAWRTEVGRALLAPDLVIQVGDHPVCRGYAELTGGSGVERVVLCDRGWPDPAGDASLVVRGDLAPIFRALAARAPQNARDAGFLARLESAQLALSHLVEEVGGEFGEGAVARVVTASVPDGGLLVVGNSLPVRELDLFCPGDVGDFPVVSQRGVSGIDGLVSGAAGSADAAGRPTILYLGDVSFLHDVGGLMSARELAAPLVIVVSNNDGGRIFEQLPVARADLPTGALERFTTPHGLSLDHAAALYGHGYARVESGPAAREAITAALARGATTVVEATVPPSAAADELAALSTRAEHVLDGLRT